MHSVKGLLIGIPRMASASDSSTLSIISCIEDQLASIVEPTGSFLNNFSNSSGTIALENK